MRTGLPIPSSDAPVRAQFLEYIIAPDTLRETGGRQFYHWAYVLTTPILKQDLHGGIDYILRNEIEADSILNLFAYRDTAIASLTQASP